MLRKTLSLLPLFLFVSLSLGASPLVFHVDEPLMIGEQLYVGGEVELRPTMTANLVAVRVNGEHVGYIERRGWGCAVWGGRASLVLERERPGVLRMTGLTIRSDGTRRTRHVEFVPVALRAGLAGARHDGTDATRVAAR